MASWPCQMITLYSKLSMASKKPSSWRSSSLTAKTHCDVEEYVQPCSFYLVRPTAEMCPVTSVFASVHVEPILSLLVTLSTVAGTCSIRAWHHRSFLQSFVCDVWVTADYDEDWNLKQAALHSHRPSKLLHSIEETPVSQWWSVVEGVENEPR